MRSYGQYCSVAKALDVIGDRWTLLIVRELLMQGECRYTDLLHGLPGIATNLLTERLRDLESAGIVTRELAPPPVAATVYRLSDAGHELEPVLRSLGRWGARFMEGAARGDEFRSHWLAFPVSEFLEDREPQGPPLSIEVRAGDRPAVIEAADGRVTTRIGECAAPDLVLEGDAQLVLGTLIGDLSVSDARRLGLRTEGRVGALRRLRSSWRQSRR